MWTLFSKFWAGYEKHHKVHTTLVAVIFSWQLAHLFWLTTTVVLPRLWGIHVFNPGPVFELLLVIVDYTEIPALLSGTILYAHLLQQQFRWRHVVFLGLINSQWLHLFWITDEFIVVQFAGQPLGLPLWLSWLAIGIDYLELPVIFDTLRRSARLLFPSPPPPQNQENIRV